MNNTNIICETFQSWEELYSGIYRQNQGKNISDEDGVSELTLMELLGLDGERPHPDTPCENPRPIIQIKRELLPVYDITDIQNYYIGQQV
jgi:hypothetical protein